jgi:hypothetical protein
MGKVNAETQYHAESYMKPFLIEIALIKTRNIITNLLTETSLFFIIIVEILIWG